MGALYKNDSSESTYEGLILHSGCPFDTPVPITLDNLDIQCNHNHARTLCGSCREGYSIALGTLHCVPCSNDYLALILLFALAGVVLVAFVLLLGLTVTAGTINGLIFYTNVIHANQYYLEVTSLSVAVAVEKQRRFFVDNLMLGVQLALRCFSTVLSFSQWEHNNF